MRLYALLAGLVVLGCQSPDELIDDVDGVDDSKADALTSSAFLATLDAASARVWLDLTAAPSATLSSHLTAAARRGVDVEVELALKAVGDGATVLAVQGLEATGVHITVDRSNPISSLRAVVDAQAFTPASGGKLKTVNDPAKVAAAAAKFAAAVAETTHADEPMAAGAVRLLPMPESTAGAIVSIIDGARKSIDLEIYQLEDALVTAALGRAAKRHVAVRVMLEPKTVGAVNYDVESKLLVAAGVTVQPTPPTFDRSGNVDHAKFMIVDAKELVVGSGNMVRSGLGGNGAGEFDTRDFWVRDTRANVVAEGARLFAADWGRSGTAGFDALVVTPDNADGEILALIAGARQRLYVYNQSLSDADILAALVAAKRRGVEVHVLLGFQPGYGGAAPKNQAALDALHAAGASAAFFRKHYLHGKVVLADERAFIGSQNFTSGGLKNNRELGEIFDDAALVDELATTFLADEANPG